MFNFLGNYNLQWKFYKQAYIQVRIQVYGIFLSENPHFSIENLLSFIYKSPSNQQYNRKFGKRMFLLSII